jgi:Zn-dependent protease
MKRFLNSPVIILLIIMAAMGIVNGRFSDPLQWAMGIALLIPGILIGISFHEFGHAYVAYKLGDPTPNKQGRVTINPFAHIDIFGFIALIIIGFGWGRPVEINPYNFKNPRRDEFLVGIAGITINFILAIAFAGILKLLIVFGFTFVDTYMGGVVVDIVKNIIVINLVLMVFNLLPVPPLDGFGILTQILNLKGTKLYYAVYDKGFIILIILLLFNIVDIILNPAVNFLFDMIIGIFF